MMKRRIAAGSCDAIRRFSVRRPAAKPVGFFARGIHSHDLMQSRRAQKIVCFHLLESKNAKRNEKQKTVKQRK
ncbi:MAG: hypothetical protein SOY30_15465 [Eubacteriales bacterium]|nr:hypothetical protein [Eubacteriales bacterium]